MQNPILTALCQLYRTRVQGQNPKYCLAIQIPMDLTVHLIKSFKNQGVTASAIDSVPWFVLFLRSGYCAHFLFIPLSMSLPISSNSPPKKHAFKWIVFYGVSKCVCMVRCHGLVSHKVGIRSGYIVTSLKMHDHVWLKSLEVFYGE